MLSNSLHHVHNIKMYTVFVQCINIIIHNVVIICDFSASKGNDMIVYVHTIRQHITVLPSIHQLLITIHSSVINYLGQ